MSKNPLVPRDALKGLGISLSVSNSRDLSHLGLTGDHCEQAVAEIARAVFLAGGSITYGGWPRPEGFTQVLLDEVLTYSDNRQALTICASLSEHAAMPDDEIDAMDRWLGTSAALVLLGPDGRPMSVLGREQARQDGELPAELSPQDRAAALSAMRKHVTAETDARVLVGGKLQGFRGAMPGLVEEALCSVAASQPLYVSAGFGGAAAAIVRVLNYDDLAWAPDGFPAGSDEEEVAEALAALTEQARDYAVDDGLTDHDRRQLSATHRSGTIATLVVQGLARWSSSRQAGDH